MMLSRAEPRDSGIRRPTTGLRPSTVVMLLPLFLGVVFNSGYALRVTDSGRPFTIPSLILAVIAVLVMMRRTITGRAVTLCYASLLVALALSAVANFSYSTLLNTAVPLLVITLAYLVVTRIGFGEFALTVVRFMRVVVLLALCVYALVNFLDVRLSLPLVYNTNGVALRNGLVVFLFDYPFAVSPALGLFWEPGVFASFVAIAAALEIAVTDRPASRLSLVLFSLGLLSTRTSAGLLFLILLVLLYVSGRLRRFATVVAIVGALVLLLAFISSDAIVEAARGSGVPAIADAFDFDERSTETRLNSPLINLLVFSESPAFGVGFSDVGAKYQGYASSRLAADSQTSTSTYLLAIVGVLGGLYTVAWIAGVMGARWLSVPERILLLTLFLMVVNKEPHITIVATYCLLFYFVDGMHRLERDGLRRSVRWVRVGAEFSELQPGGLGQRAVPGQRLPVAPGSANQLRTTERMPLEE